MQGEARRSMTMAPSHEAFEEERSVEFGWMPSQLAAQYVGEDWTGVTSTAQRRKLQNRLNQRAHRKRRKGTELSPTEVHVARREDDGNDNEAHICDMANTHAIIQPQRVAIPGDLHQVSQKRQRKRSSDGLPFTTAEVRHFARLAHFNYTHGVLDLQQLPRLTLHNFWIACKNNAEIVGVAESWLEYDAISPWVRPGLSQPSSSAAAAAAAQPTSHSSYSFSFTHCPPSLHPTIVQQSISHHPWLDIIPIPRLRDNILLAITEEEEGISSSSSSSSSSDPVSGDPAGRTGPRRRCDEDELCEALFESGGVLVWGEAWDPRSWEIGLGYWSRWGWLLEGCAELVESTNYWRAKRGERRLVPPWVATVTAWGQESASWDFSR